MSGVSIHAVDVASGRPATGMQVELYATEPTRRLLAEGTLGTDGALAHAITRTRLEAGTYEAVFHVGDHLGSDAFLTIVPFRFRISDPDEHYHLPFKFTPWGFSLFRGR